MIPRLLVVAAVVVVVLVATRLYRAWQARERAVDPLDLPPLPSELRSDNAIWIVFTTPYCATCGPVKERISRLDPTAELLEVDVSERPDLADLYRVRTAPTILFAAANGRVQARFVGNVPETDLETARG